MKRLLIAAILTILFTRPTKGQVLISLLLGDKLNSGKIEFGLDGGVNYPQLRGLDGDLKSRFNIGFYFDIKTKNPHWLIHTGVLVKSSLGTSGLPVYTLGDAALDSSFRSGSVERKINYFNVPLMMKYRFKNNFFAEGGIMPSLRHKSYDLFSAEINGDDLEYKKDIGDQLHRIDFGLMAGVGYRLMGGNGMNLGVRYYYGLVNVVTSESVPTQYNQSLFLSVGIPIGAGKARERELEKKASDQAN